MHWAWFNYRNKMLSMNSTQERRNGNRSRSNQGEVRRDAVSKLHNYASCGFRDAKYVIVHGHCVTLPSISKPRNYIKSSVLCYFYRDILVNMTRSEL